MHASVENSISSTSDVARSTHLTGELAVKLENTTETIEFARRSLAQCAAQDRALADACVFEDQSVAALVLELNDLRRANQRLKEEIRRETALQAAFLTSSLQSRKRTVNDLRDSIAQTRREYEETLTECFILERSIQMYANEEVDVHQTSSGEAGVESMGERSTAMLSDNAVFGAFLSVASSTKLTEKIEHFLRPKGGENAPVTDSRARRKLGDLVRQKNTGTSPEPLPALLRLPPLELPVKEV